MLSDLQNECKGILSVKDRNSWNGADDGSWCFDGRKDQKS